ncbi:hypothetical protein SCFA_1000001 [anaerobic digester metagenome]|uniref:Uncharacterized protein n=1 Tax=anaerobic digester metagenome TaxID=1263854 RepID=A0A485LUD1_9ZZZZ
MPGSIPGVGFIYGLVQRKKLLRGTADG